MNGGRVKGGVRLYKACAEGGLGADGKLQWNGVNNRLKKVREY